MLSSYIETICRPGKPDVYKLKPIPLDKKPFYFGIYADRDTALKVLRYFRKNKKLPSYHDRVNVLHKLAKDSKPKRCTQQKKYSKLNYDRKRIRVTMQTINDIASLYEQTINEKVLLKEIANLIKSKKESLLKSIAISEKKGRKIDISSLIEYSNRFDYFLPSTDNLTCDSLLSWRLKHLKKQLSLKNNTSLPAIKRKKSLLDRIVAIELYFNPNKFSDLC
jgi:hypothetical protein